MARWTSPFRLGARMAFCLHVHSTLTFDAQNMALCICTYPFLNASLHDRIGHHWKPPSSTNKFLFQDYAKSTLLKHQGHELFSLCIQMQDEFTANDRKSRFKLPKKKCPCLWFLVQTRKCLKGLVLQHFVTAQGHKNTTFNPNPPIILANCKTEQIAQSGEWVLCATGKSESHGQPTVCQTCLNYCSAGDKKILAILQLLIE